MDPQHCLIEIGIFFKKLTVGREDGDLLATSNGVHDVDGGDASLNHLLRVDTRPRVDGLTLHTERQVVRFFSYSALDLEW
jgi:hypothetical protein